MNIIDLYKQLFGRKGIEEGDVISMSEHGRAGGVSTGQPFKHVMEYSEPSRIDVTSDGTIYIGYTKNGSIGSTSSAIFRIERILPSGTEYIIGKAGGDDDYDQIWDNRASLTYS